MSAHVVVIDSTARRVTVKTTPNKPLSDVLEEACTKFNLKASNYGLKNNNKQVDLSRTFRLSGLTSGAKLELVQLSRSAGVVSVALQLPTEEAAGIPNGRFTDKFPSSTTLWQLLRKSEEGVAGGQTKRNLTQRGVPSTKQGGGRLYYEQPVLQIMQREISSLADLNKTLAQLGYNGGSVLIKLSFRATETPLEEAAVQIAQYFIAVDEEGKTGSAAKPRVAAQANSIPEQKEPEQPEWTHDNEPEGAPETSTQQSQQTPSDTAAQSNGTPSEPTAPLSSPRISGIFRPPSSSMPSAAQMAHNDSDYTPTIEHAQSHQKRLNDSSRNVRLPTDAEIAAQEAAEQEKLAAIKEVEIRIRFPDQQQISFKFSDVDTGNTLYTEIKTALDPRYADEPFLLRDPSTRVKGDILTIPPNDKKLIQQLGLKGRVLLVFAWADGASLPARGALSVLKEELRARAVDLKVNDVAATVANDENDRGVRVNVGKQEDKKDEGGGIGKKMPKWLKGLGKK